jgi:hypothetical protein
VSTILQRSATLSSPSPGWGAQLIGIEAAKAHLGTLMSTSRYVSSVRALVARAQALGCPVLLGASREGGALAGAMALQCQDLSLYACNDSDVLLVDGVVASVEGLRCAAEHARVAGASAVRALVLGSVIDLTGVIVGDGPVTQAVECQD